MGTYILLKGIRPNNDQMHNILIAFTEHGDTGYWVKKLDTKNTETVETQKIFDAW